MGCTKEKSWFDSRITVHPIPNSLSNGTVSPAVKRLELEGDHSPPSSAKVRKEWGCTSTDLMYLRGVRMDTFTL